MNKGDRRDEEKQDEAVPRAGAGYAASVHDMDGVGGVQVTDANKGDITKAIKAAITNGAAGTVSGSASYDPEKKILTLNGFAYSGSGQNNAAIYWGESSALTLNLIGGSNVTGPNISSGVTYGILSNGNITVSGSGSLTGKGGTATRSYGVYAENGSITVSGGSLTGEGGSDGGASFGVYAGSGISVTGSGSLTGTGGDANLESCGVHASSSITVTGSSLTGTGGDANLESCGVFANGGSVTVNGGVVEAQGKRQAFNKEPAIGSGYTAAKVWYGDTKAGAAGPDGPDALAQKYTEKYVRIEVACSVSVTTDGNGTAKADPESGEPGTKVTLTATPNAGYQFKEWQVLSGGVTIKDNAFTMGNENVEIKAVFEPIPGPVDLPQTGDTSTPMLWLAMGTLSVLGIVLLRKKAYSKSR